MTITEENTKKLTVEQYEFYKQKENPMTDAQIMNVYKMDNNALHKWKKEHNLIGKKYGMEAQPNVKVTKGNRIKENPSPIPTVEDYLKENPKTSTNNIQRTPEVIANIEESSTIEMKSLLDKLELSEDIINKLKSELKEATQLKENRAYYNKDHFDQLDANKELRNQIDMLRDAGRELQAQVNDKDVIIENLKAELVLQDKQLEKDHKKDIVLTSLMGMYLDLKNQEEASFAEMEMTLV